MDIPSTLQNLPLPSVMAIVAGAVVLIVPRILNYAVAIYLLAVGVFGLFHYFNGYSLQPQSLLSIVAGMLVLIRPNIISYVIGIYLILIGLLESGVVRF